jgi:hypothetical protein
MKNIHVLSTDKPSRLWMDSDNNLNLHIIPTTLFKMQNIYITSDEEKPKAGEWSLYQNKIHKCIEDIIGDEFKKIILTTDQDLIVDGVQPIDDEFLKWFVKNPSCEEVEVKIECTNCDDCNCQYHDPCLKPKYNIVKDMIRYSKEEPKQETLEEVAERLYKKGCNIKEKNIEIYRRIFIDGVKWQQEQDKNKYSEEEVRKAIQETITLMRYKATEFREHEDTVIKQFKKK